MDVKIGARDGSLVEITEGLTGEEQVIVAGKDLVQDGTPVQTQPFPQS
jgi:membrane fusion protein (multidrug efflux system)